MSIRIPNFSSFNQYIEPFRTYHLGRGLTLSFREETGTLIGGKDKSLTYHVDPKNVYQSVPTQFAYRSVVSKIENDTTARLIAASRSQISFDTNTEEAEPILTELAPDRVLFNVGDRYLSDADLGELLLFELNRVEDNCRKRQTGCGETENTFNSAYEVILYWKEQIRAGQIDPSKLEQLINLTPPMLNEAFFIINMIEIGESIRSALLRANYHFVCMTEMIWRANMGQKTSASTPFPLGKEIGAMGPDIDRIADEYTSSVLASYSALDMLYEYFVFLTRQPFGEPHFPKKLHFPDPQPSSAFLDGGSARPDDIGPGILPFAIPNLSEKVFSHLRLLRNDLVHNMAADSHRPVAYIGTELPPVGGLSVQYTQYLCRDVGIDGEPLTHKWNRRFYIQQRDAQLELYELIELVWQCCFDTVRWLSHRLRSMDIEQK